MRIAHQREATRDILLLANPSATPVAGALLCGFGGDMLVWDPETGRVSEEGAKNRGEPLTVAIAADSARFVMFERNR